MEHPRTDDDWVRLAECIVTKISYLSPEEVGQLSVEATTTVFSWYKGDEKRIVYDKRRYAQNRMIELGVEAGCLERAPEPSFADYAAMESMGHPMVGRSFPETYMDWVNLAEDIKDKHPSYAPMVNDALGIIGGMETGDVDDAKRWLTGKAAELNIT